MSDVSSSTAGDSLASNLICTSQHVAVNRLIKGLQAIRTLINRSSLNQMVLDRQLRQQLQQAQFFSQSTQSKMKKNVDIDVNIETDDVILFFLFSKRFT